MEKPIEITIVKKSEYDCSVYLCKAKKLFKLYVAFNMYQGTSVVLCKDHLNELGCAIADVLDPPKRVAGLKASEDNAIKGAWNVKK